MDGGAGASESRSDPMQLNEAAAALTNPTRSTPHLSLLSSLELEEDIPIPGRHSLPPETRSTFARVFLFTKEKCVAFLTPI